MILCQMRGKYWGDWREQTGRRRTEGSSSYRNRMVDTDFPIPREVMGGPIYGSVTTCIRCYRTENGLNIGFSVQLGNLSYRHA
ncbi:hypothetical protein [Pasteuria penetrans]|uniref:hypothetical protein n=1 Tax=Pasteuria penetrans TaxID=86005 RepID=UPI000FBDB549|nr:hypothetical protein [Pasteuria penetrans]